VNTTTRIRRFHVRLNISDAAYAHLNNRCVPTVGIPDPQALLNE
jgi:hypothetical protein